MDQFAPINAAFQALGSISSWQIIGAITAAGTVAMAILQLIKDLTPLRRIYQRFWLRRWISNHAKTHTRKTTASNEKAAAEAHASLIRLATGGSEDAFYELAAEQLVAQMNAAVLITLDYPKTHRDLLETLAHGADPEDVTRTITGVPKFSRRETAGPAPNYLEARNRVSHQIQRNLDAIQISMSSRWKFWMQVSSIVLSTLVLEAALIATAGANGTVLVTALIIGIAGGYFAPVSRDLVAALQTLRK
jgi:hypothetical protein